MPLHHHPLLLATAIEAALRAGDLQLARLGPTVQIGKKGKIDLVTSADIEVEQMIRDLIGQRYPDHQVLAEELQDDRVWPERTGPCWVFDPIDGTVNYAHGLPIFCASVALEINGRPEIGAVYDPNRGELFTAEREGGAFLNGHPLHVAAASVLEDAMLCTGFPYDVHETLDEVVGLFGAFVGRARAVRRLGSAALDLCYLAAGRLDGFWEQRLKPWDVSAAALVVQEAGGRVTSWDGAGFDSRDSEVVAGNPAVHARMLAVIHDFQQRRSGIRTI